MKNSLIAIVAGSMVLAEAVAIRAETWSPSSGTAKWSDATSWVGGTIPSAVGAEAIFATPSGARNLDLNGTFTVGTLTFDNSSATTATNSVRNFNVSGDLLTFDAPGDGPAVITSSGSSTNLNRLESHMHFADNVVANVTNTLGNASAGALSLTGNITGPGGLTKTGDGQITVAYNAAGNGQIKAWEGPTLVSGGRWRTSQGGTDGMLTSSFTINGGQLTMITHEKSYTFGPGPLNLNGFGPTSGPYAQSPGAIRPMTNLYSTITNDIVVQTDASIALDGPSHSLSFTGNLQGSGRLYLGGVDSSYNIKDLHGTNHGTLFLKGGHSTNSGGVSIVQGRIYVMGPNADLGLGNITVHGLYSDSAGFYAAGELFIGIGVANAIADNAQLSLEIGNGFGGGTVVLDTGVNETVGSLILNGTTQVAGTYGSSASGATFRNNNYFLGPGIITVAGLTGDHNRDGKVDAADYLLWRKTPNAFGGDPAGYNAWRSNFGTGTGSGSALGSETSAIPEPSTWVLIFSLLCQLLLALGRERIDEIGNAFAIDCCDPDGRFHTSGRHFPDSVTAQAF